MNPAVETVMAYHQRSKHHPRAHAASLGYMDWENQPEPFRFFPGAPVVALPLDAPDPAFGHRHLYLPTPHAVEITADSISTFWALSMGLSAWKTSGGSRWSLRMNPSSGNLHPTEGYALLPARGPWAEGVYHYNPFYHRLEQRLSPLPKRLFENSFMVSLTSIFWRESWKYGERAFRYCQLDVGHALAAMRFAANLLGWRLELSHPWRDADIASWLGLDRTRWFACEAEYPELMAQVYPAHAGENHLWTPHDPDRQALAAPSGQPNPLSREHVRWEVIDQVAAASVKNQPDVPQSLPKRPAMPVCDHLPPAAEIIRNRRSATAFDPTASMQRSDFLAMLAPCLPSADRAPFDAGLGAATIHLVLFVHRVTDLRSGLYVLMRNENHIEPLKSDMKDAFVWETVDDVLPLYRLATGDFMETAAQIACGQDIAGDGIWAAGMLARFESRVRTYAHHYRHLFWEAGMIGQVLYLEAEARKYRGTGIGCYFDDVMHRLLGLQTTEWQSMYHFTVGRPIEDPRLSTLSAYHHLNRENGA